MSKRVCKPWTTVEIARLVIGFVVLVACGIGEFWDHVERRFMARYRRLTPGWIIYLATLIAVLAWPALPVAMARLRGGEHSSSGH